LAARYYTSRSRSVFVSGDYAYIADEFNGLHVVDISNPEDPVFAGIYNTGGDVQSVFVVGRYAYLAVEYSGLHIVDVSDPADPVLVGFCPVQSYALDVFLADNFAYITCWSLGMVVMDITDPANPYQVGDYDTPGWAYNVVAASDDAGNYIYVMDYSSLLVLHQTHTGAFENKIEIPQNFSLSQNYPNPFNAATVIRYTLPEPANVVIEIYDILGRRVKTLISEQQQAGYHQVIWNSQDNSSGIYFYRIQAGDYTETRKMLLLR